MDYSIGFMKEKKINQGISAHYVRAFNAIFNKIRESKYLDLSDLSTFTLDNTLRFFRANAHLWGAVGYNYNKNNYCLFIRYLVREYRIYDFTHFLKSKKEPARLPRLFRNNEINKMLSNSQEYEKNIVLFFLYTGVRKFEFLSLRRSDIRSGCIRIKKGKGKKERLIPIHPELRGVIDKLDYNYTEYHLLRLGQKYKKIVKDYHWHRWRHTFATNLLRSGVEIFTIKELLGHTDISTTTIYLSLDMDKKKEALEKLSFSLN